jgi:hypothetical protein
MSAHDVAIVHDYLSQKGGAERVVLAMAQAFPEAPVYTSVYSPGATFPEFRDLDVRPLWTNRLGALRRDHRSGLPLYPLAFSSTTIDAEVTLCSSSGFAHGVRTTGRKVSYCYTRPAGSTGRPTPIWRHGHRRSGRRPEDSGVLCGRGTSGRLVRPT